MSAPTNLHDQAFVEDMHDAARGVGRAYLPGSEDLVFGFVQRVLVRLQQAGRPRGLLFPKFDAEYRRMFDYMDGEGGVWVLLAADVKADPAWFTDHDAGDPEQAYFQVSEGAETRIVQAFLDALDELKKR